MGNGPSQDALYRIALSSYQYCPDQRIQCRIHPLTIHGTTKIVLAMTGDGLKAVAKAAELMVELLGSKAANEALSHKRKTIKLGDVERAGVLLNQQTLAAC